MWEILDLYVTIRDVNPARNAQLPRLLPVAYALQAVFASVYVPWKTEKYYDSCVGFPSPSVFAPRQLFVTTAMGIWSIRLGTFLALRTIKAGDDSPFNDVKDRPLHFTMFGSLRMLIATWISMVGLPVHLCNVLPANLHPPLRQKSAWRRSKDAKQHEEKFITSGLWSITISRHPNYLGENGVWTRIWAFGIGIATLSPLCFALDSTCGSMKKVLLCTHRIAKYVSGVPPLEEAGDRKFGQDPKWHEYKRTVPIFWPWASR
ncbi:hypothetical protein F5887DRAFT_1059900 [Amanita rubescens]|nr:hypothetical protein F5887DRAFT_1059900 [Amanita rubescens]